MCEGVGVDEVEKEGSGGDGGDDDEGEKGDSDNDDDEEDGDGDEEDDGEDSCEGASVDPEDNRPFILPAEWAVKKFLPSMSDKVFKELHVRYQIPKHISNRLPKENKKCYSGRTLIWVCMTLCSLPDLGFR